MMNICIILQPYDLPSELRHPVTPTVQEQVPADSVFLGRGTCGLVAWLQSGLNAAELTGYVSAVCCGSCLDVCHWDAALKLQKPIKGFAIISLLGSKRFSVQRSSFAGLFTSPDVCPSAACTTKFYPFLVHTYDLLACTACTQTR